MVRVHMLIREDQAVFLSNTPGTISELIRQAIDDLIAKRQKGAITSPSKKGDFNGRSTNL